MEIKRVLKLGKQHAHVSTASKSEILWCKNAKVEERQG